MEEHLEIFEELDKIKELIPEQNYINLCKYASDLLKEIERYQEGYPDEEYYSEYDTDYEHAEELPSHDDYVSSDRETLEQEPVPEPVPEQEINSVECFCEREINIEKPIDYFSDKCFENIENMEKCENFKKFVELNPLLSNIFSPCDINFVTKPEIRDYDKIEMVKKVRGLLIICDRIKTSRNKAIVSLTSFSTIIKNYKFALDHDGFKNVFLEKIKSFINGEPVFLETCTEFNVNVDDLRELTETIDN